MFNNKQDSNIGNFDSKDKLSLIVFGFLSLLIIVLTRSLLLQDPSVFQWLFGTANPYFLITMLAFIGILSLYVLQNRFDLQIIQKLNSKGLMISYGFALLFGVIIIVIDLFFPFSEGINVPFPQSLLFYPIIGYVAEIAFHLVPLTIILTLSTKAFEHSDRKRILLIAIFLVALMDPVFQLLSGGTGEYNIWITGLITCHIFLVNLFEVNLFRKYDFMTMYIFRLMYYLHWHIIWGYLRLFILF